MRGSNYRITGMRGEVEISVTGSGITHLPPHVPCPETFSVKIDDPAALRALHEMFGRALAFHDPKFTPRPKVKDPPP